MDIATATRRAMAKITSKSGTPLVSGVKDDWVESDDSKILLARQQSTLMLTEKADTWNYEHMHVDWLEFKYF